MLLLRHQRPEIDRRIEAMTDLELAGLGHHSIHDAIVYRLVGEQPRAGRAALALVVEDGGGGAGNGEIEIGIRKHDRGRLAAQLERHALQISGGGLDDQLADFGRTGERHLIHVRMLGKRRARRLAVAGDDVDHAVRNARFLNQFAEAQGGRAASARPA